MKHILVTVLVQLLTWSSTALADKMISIWPVGLGTSADGDIFRFSYASCYAKRSQDFAYQIKKENGAQWLTIVLKNTIDCDSSHDSRIYDILMPRLDRNLELHIANPIDFDCNPTPGTCRDYSGGSIRKL